MNRLVAMAIGLLAAAGMVVAVTGTSHASASTSCTVKPVLPKRVVVHQAVVGMTTKVTLSGSGCGAVDKSNSEADVQLVHNTDSYWLMWYPLGSKDTQSVYSDEIVPGSYSTTAPSCDLEDSNYDSIPCSVAKASTIMKFGARPKLTISRSGSRRKFHVVATRYTAYNGWQHFTDTVLIQRLSGGRWVTIHKATAYGKSGYTWSNKRISRAKFRARSLETKKMFQGTSATVTG